MDSIGDTQGFSGKTPITLSRGFSIEILTEVTLSWKTEYSDGCSTAVKIVDGGLDFIFHFLFYFLFSFSLIFYF